MLATAGKPVERRPQCPRESDASLVNAPIKAPPQPPGQERSEAVTKCMYGAGLSRNPAGMSATSVVGHARWRQYAAPAHRRAQSLLREVSPSRLAS